MKLIGKDEETARAAEAAFYAENSGEDPVGDVEPPSDVVVWLCAHCMDLPSQQDPLELHEIKTHIKTVYGYIFSCLVCAELLTSIPLLFQSHYVADPQYNIDYYQDFEAPQGYWSDTLPRVSQIEWSC
jgi:hypothetical protein